MYQLDDVLLFDVTYHNIWQQSVTLNHCCENNQFRNFDLGR